MSTNLKIFHDDKIPTAVYVFHKSPENKNQNYFGFVRKIPQGGRVPSYKGNIGAAGTDIKYHGKWTSIGGGAKGDKTNINRAIDELNDETSVESRLKIKFTSRNVDFSNLGIPFSLPDRILLKCHLAQNYNNIAVFLFEIEDGTLFFSLFPEQGYTGQELATSSYKEIDAIKSFTMQQIVDLQKDEIKSSQNYFTKYCITTFQNIIKPKICILNSSFSTKWCSTIIDTVNDINPRSIKELSHSPYKNKYLKYKTKYLELKNNYNQYGGGFEEIKIPEWVKIENYRTMTDEKKKAAVDGDENSQYEWMVEEVNEFYEAVNKQDIEEIKDEAIGLIRTYQQFNIDSVKKLWEKVKKDVAKVFDSQKDFSEAFKKWHAKKLKKGQAKDVTEEQLLKISELKLE